MSAEYPGKFVPERNFLNSAVDDRLSIYAGCDEFRIMRHIRPHEPACQRASLVCPASPWLPVKGAQGLLHGKPGILFTRKERNELETDLLSSPAERVNEVIELIA
jgi:hypothetical protein